MFTMLLHVLSPLRKGFSPVWIPITQFKEPPLYIADIMPIRRKTLYNQPIQGCIVCLVDIGQGGKNV